MDFLLFWQSALLGIIEGLTEYLPVSSTGHLIVAQDLLGFEGPPGKFFEVVIQVGAIAAIVVLYFERFRAGLVGAFREPEATRFVTNIALGCAPALALGALLHKPIKAYLFSPWTVAVSLIVGGVVILLAERRGFDQRHDRVEDFSLGLAFKIGLCQVIAMIPGVSRSGATIIGALFLGASRKAAAEFSFFLAAPTLTAAAAFDLLKNWSALDGTGVECILVGLVAAFVSGLLVVKWFVGFISRHGFEAFGWYRIAAGLAIMALLLAGFGS